MSETTHRSYNDFSNKAIYTAQGLPSQSTNWTGWQDDYSGDTVSTPVTAENLNAMLNMIINIRNVIGKTTEFEGVINGETINPPNTDGSRSLATCLKEAFSAIVGEAEIALDGLNTSLQELEDNVSNNSGRIDNLEGTLIKHTIDSTEAYSKSVPTDSALRAILNRVGGKRIYDNLCTDSIGDGIPFEIEGAGNFQYIFSIDTPGSYGYNFKIVIESDDKPDYAKLYCNESGSTMINSLGAGSSMVTVRSYVNFLFNIGHESGKQFTDTHVVKGRIYLNIVEGYTIPTEYNPAPILTKVTEIISKSANKIPFPYIKGNTVKGNGYKKTVNGITWTVDAIGRIKANGTAEKICYFTFCDGHRLPDGVYELSGCPFGGGSNSYGIWVARNEDNRVICHDYGDGGSTLIQGDNQISANIYIAKGTTVTNLVFYPQLRRIIRYPIPEEVQKKEGYGTDEGYIDFDRKKWVYGDSEEDVSNILTDYSDYKFIEVDGGGELIAENTNKNPVPWTVTFAEI